MRAGDDAGHLVFALDAVPRDELGDQRRALLGRVDQLLAAPLAVAGDDVLRVVLGGRRDMAGVAGSAPADLVRPRQRHARAPFGGVQRRRAAADAAADDGDVGALRLRAAPGRAARRRPR